METNALIGLSTVLLFHSLVSHLLVGVCVQACICSQE
jgi:hypothetical protein